VGHLADARHSQRVRRPGRGLGPAAGGVLTWDDLLAERRAWDALIWFAPLLMMADALQENGVIGVLSGSLFGHLGGLPWIAGVPGAGAGLPVPALRFASMTAHVTRSTRASSPRRWSRGSSGPRGLFPGVLFQSGRLPDPLRHRSAPIFFGAGYVSQGNLVADRFLVSLLNW
jgi:DASS family divalent anion:Na+ symporter